MPIPKHSTAIGVFESRADAEQASFGSLEIAIRATAIGVFESRVDAEQAVYSLLKVAFGATQIGMVLPDAPTAQSNETVPVPQWEGKMIRLLIGLEIPDGEITYYEDACRDGYTLVIARAGERYPDAMDILNRCGGVF